MALSLRNIWVKRLIILLLSAGVVIAALQIWFQQNAEHVIEDLVKSQSKGKISLQVRKIKYNFLSKKIQLLDAVFKSTDSATAPTAYSFAFKDLRVKVQSFWPLLLKKQLLVDSIALLNPDIVVTRLRKDTTSRGSSVSITNEMGRVYNSIIQTLDDLEVKKFMIENAKFSLINKLDPEQGPIQITNINFHLFRKDPNQPFMAQKDAPDMLLHTYNQSFMLPDGIHHIAFTNLRIYFLKKSIDIDSCSINTLQKDSTQTTFKGFFDNLKLVNVDFNAMYTRDLIKADSVYCTHPRFDIAVIRQKNNGQKKKKTTPPDLDKIIRSLTGDLQLGYVGILNGDVNITKQRENQSQIIFSSTNNNFELEKLNVNADSTTPVSVGRFSMAIHDYKAFNADSSVSYSFDSVNFNNNRVALKNFVLQTVTNRKLGHSDKKFEIPNFELEGLDWNGLLFDQKFTARNATLYNPTIYYKKTNTSISKRPINLFRSLQSLDEFVALQDLKIIHGNVNMQFNAATKILLKNTSIVLKSDELLASENTGSIRNSLKQLQFESGNFTTAAFTANMNNVNIEEEKKFRAATIQIQNTNKTMNINANNVLLNDVILDKNKNVSFDGLQWSDAVVTLSKPTTNKKLKGGNATFTNIDVRNTKLIAELNGGEATTFINSLKASSIGQKEDGSPDFNNVQISGTEISYKKEMLNLKTGDYTILPNANSFINKVQFSNITRTDTATVQIPKLVFTPVINNADKNISFSSITAASPVIKFILTKKPDTLTKKDFPEISIGKINITNPDIFVKIKKNDSTTMLSLPDSGNTKLTIANLITNKNGDVIADEATFNSKLFLITSNEKVNGIKKGIADVAVENIHINLLGKDSDWKAGIRSFNITDAEPFYLTKTKGILSVKTFGAGGLNITGSSLKNLDSLFKTSPNAWIKNTSVYLKDSIKELALYNANYEPAKKIFHIDSFLYKPSLSRDSFMKAAAFETDYAIVNTKDITLTGFDLKDYSKKNVLAAESIIVNEPVIDIYRDKRLTDKPEILVPLPTTQLQQQAKDIDIKKMVIKNGFLSYTEASQKTGAEGTITLKELNGTVRNIKNRNIQQNDSLEIQATALLLDSLKLKMLSRESYADSLGGFILNASASGSDLGFLNKALVPMANVNIKSGELDTMFMKAEGNEYLSQGEMEMYYHDLKVQLIRDGDKHKSSLFTKLMTFVVNKFVIKTNNDKRKGAVYFSRARNKSFFNYIVKMAFSGMASNTGATKERKYRKRYLKKAKELNIPTLQWKFEDNP